MKANEAPEKIWMNEDWVHQFDDKDFMDEDSVEYVRKDAFIEKAAVWFNNYFITHDEYDVISKQFDTGEEMFEDFKKYMEG